MRLSHSYSAPSWLVLWRILEELCGSKQNLEFPFLSTATIFMYVYCLHVSPSLRKCDRKLRMLHFCRTNYGLALEVLACCYMLLHICYHQLKCDRNSGCWISSVSVGCSLEGRVCCYHAYRHPLSTSEMWQKLRMLDFFCSNWVFSWGLSMLFHA
jgi:hypothetical protein